MKRQLGWWIAVGALIALAAWAAPARAADKPAQAPAPSPDAKAQADAQQKEGQQTVETILRQQEDLLAGRTFSYDPGGRRDPFRSLIEEAALKAHGPRPRGVAGMMVAELALTGIVRDSSGGNIAVVTGTDSKGYFLHVGDEVYDGSVITVDPAAGTVTFRQQVDDPRLIKPYRDVVKRLVPQGEEKSQ
ncbi:MAG TPA: hypothetical protein VFV19_12865 [Candidatus Polarisedimenticolaceae bacterium]|nr:hypothetical protein [Candidatus Polarisedimenticolaceae bacterium]